MPKRYVLCNSGVLFVMIMLTAIAVVIAGSSAKEKKDDTDNTTASKAEVLSIDQIKELGQKEPIGLLKYAIENYEKNIQDYTGIFHKQEQIHGKLGKKQIIQFKFKDSPYSLLMSWKKNPAGADKLLYVEGKYDGEIIVHPTGLMKWMKSVRRDPAGKEALRSSQNPCYWFGSYRTMKRMLQTYELAAKQGELKADFLGEMTVDGRPCLLMERITPQKQGYSYARLKWAFDPEYLVPTWLKAWDWKGNLYFEYTLKDLKYNVGLTDKEFTPEANGL